MGFILGAMHGTQGVPLRGAAGDVHIVAMQPEEEPPTDAVMPPPAPAQWEHVEMCSICLEPLCSEAVTPFIKIGARAQQRASCRHYCHLRCARKLQSLKCPNCRVPFERLRRVTPRGVLEMTAPEVMAALGQLHGGPATVAAAADLVAAIFPITADAAITYLQQNARQPADVRHNPEPVDLEAGNGGAVGAVAADRASRVRCSRSSSSSIAVPVQETTLAQVLHHFSHVCPGATPRAVQYYSRAADQGCYIHLTGQRRPWRCRRVTMRCFTAAGGACRGALIGLAIGALGGITMRKPPHPYGASAADFGADDGSEAAGTTKGWGCDLIRFLVDAFDPSTIFGSAFLTVFAALLIWSITTLLSKVLTYLGRNIVAFWRYTHRVLWARIGTATIGAASTDQAGCFLWGAIIFAFAVFGALAGSLHAAIVAESTARTTNDSAFAHDAARSFWMGLRAGCCCFVRRRRRHSPPVEGDFGDGSLREFV